MVATSGDEGNKYLVPILGLTSEVASEKIAKELERVIHEYKNKRDPKLRSFDFWNGFLLSLKTVEGIIFVLSLMAFFSSEIAVYIGCKALSASHLFEIIATLLTFIPLVTAYIFVKTKLKRAELIRAFAQVEETFRLLTSNVSTLLANNSLHLPVSNLFAKHHIWSPPSSTVLCVLRNKRWVSIPSNMLADGDIFKLYAGNTFPVDAVRVRLVAISVTEDKSSLGSDYNNQRFVIPVIVPNSKYYKSGEVFKVTKNSTEDELSASLEVLQDEELSHTIHEDVFQGIESPQEERLYFSDAVCRCIPLAMGTFLALSFPCTEVVSGFLAAALSTKGSSNRRNTKFFEMLHIVESILFYFFLLLLFFMTIMNVFWTLSFSWRPSMRGSSSLCFNVVFIQGLWRPIILLALLFVPLIHDLLAEITDVWGNARLQSLFQWLQDTRVPCTSETPDGKPGSVNKLRNRCPSPQGHDVKVSQKDTCLSYFLSSSSSSSLSTHSLSSRSKWSSQDSFGNSVGSEMSISRLPFKNQFLELLAILSQGLDGPSNLLHTLNSTTSLVFVDEKGLLTDTHRTIQEVCIPKEIKSNTFPRALPKDSLQFSKPDMPSTDKGSSPSVPFTKLPYRTTGLMDRVVLDVLPDEAACDGQRFENTDASKEVTASLKPLVTLMAVAKLPLTCSQYKDFSQSYWLFAQTIRDVFVSDAICDEAYKECVCSLRSVAGVSRRTVSRLVLSRFFVLVQCRLLKHLSLETDQKVYRTTRQSNIVLCGWLVKDIKTGSHQMVTKGDPRHILRRCLYYFNGDVVLPLPNTLRHSLLQIIDQWKGDGLECLAYGYRPLSKEHQYQCLHRLDEHSLFVMNPEIESLVPATSSLTFVEKNSASLDKKTVGRVCRDDSKNRDSQRDALEAIRIFPGPRSSIGALPRVAYYGNLTPLSVNNKIVLTLKPKQEQCSQQNNSAWPKPTRPLCFFDYNNLLTSSHLCLPCSSMTKSPHSTGSCASHSQKPHSQSGDNSTSSILSNEPKGSFLGRLLNKQIFLGMVALRLSTPQELAARITSFHEAGIRFVYMSREDDAKTKSVGSLLGLETDWNCLVSLEPVENRVVNAVGNVVVPSGIECIEAHIRDVDDVPLQVSLFSRGTSTSMRQMIQILQNNGEVVTCVGSARRCSNFLPFEQANCAISVSIDKPLVCKECLGRRCIGQLNRHIFSTLPKEFEVSAALSSLPCALHINISNVSLQTMEQQSVFNTPVKSPSDPRWLLELLYEAFKESRRIVRAIEQSIFFFAAVNMGFVAPTFWLTSILFTPPYFRITSLIFFNSICLPLVVITFLQNPAGETIMKEFPLRSQDHEEKKREILHICFLTFLQFSPSSFVCIVMLNNYFISSVKLYTRLLTQQNSFLQVDLQQCIALRGLDAFFGRWIPCVESIYIALDRFPISMIPPLLHTYLVGIFLFILFSFVLSLSRIDRAKNLCYFTPLRNLWLIFAWCLVFFLYICLLGAVLILNQTWAFIARPSLLFFLLLFIWPIFLVVLNEFIKTQERRKDSQKQKYLKLLFTTRLGMWSPR